MSEKIFFRPAIPLLISLMGGIWLGADFPGFMRWIGAAAVIGFAFCLLHIFRRKTLRLIPILLFISLGYLSVQPWVSPRIPADHISRYMDANRWEITGRIVTEPQNTHNRTRFHLQVRMLDLGGRIHPVSGKLRVTVGGDSPALAVGDKIEFTSRIRPITNFNNPGGFDYKRHMAFKGVPATAYVDGSKLIVLERSPVGGVAEIINGIRRRFARLIDQCGSTQAHAVLKALIIGDRSRISDETRQAFNQAGVGHLLAISGLHIGIVATAAFFLFRHLTATIEFLLWRAWTRKAAALLSLLPVAAYGLIAGLSPSTQRAVIMVSIFLMTFLLEREQDPFNTIALAALAILIGDPPALFSISFQLSFTAVFAIVYGLGRLKNRSPGPQSIRKNWRRRVIGRLVSFFLVSLFAVCGSLPLIAYYFNQISLVGLVANFVVVPLVGFIAIPLGLAALFVLPLSTVSALGCIEVAGLVLGYALKVVHFFADLPFAAVNIFTPTVFEIGCYYILGWTLLTLYGRSPAGVDKIGGDAGGESERNFSGLEMVSSAGGVIGQKLPRIFRRMPLAGVLRADSIKVVLILAIIAAAGDTCYWLHQRWWHPDLRITVIDVGHGSASLVEFPGGYTMLIDGGGFADNSTFDVGKSIIAPILRRKKIRIVDSLVLSHANSDHLNGLIYIAGHFHVKSIWTNSEAAETWGYRNLLKVTSDQHIGWPAFSHLPRRQQIKGVGLDFLYPPQDFLKKRDTQKWRNLNNNSLVVKVSLGETSFLFPGDIMADAEMELVGIAGSRLKSTVLIAPHHGSRSSSTDAFIRGVDPRVVIVSSGRRGRFNLPNPAVMQKYRDMGCSIYRTNINGAISLSTDGRRLEIKPLIPTAAAGRGGAAANLVGFLQPIFPP